MSSKIDEGKIVKRLEIPLDFYDSWIEINEKILRKTDLMIKKFIPSATNLNGIQKIKISLRQDILRGGDLRMENLHGHLNVLISII